MVLIFPPRLLLFSHLRKYPFLAFSLKNQFPQGFNLVLFAGTLSLGNHIYKHYPTLNISEIYISKHTYSPVSIPAHHIICWTSPQASLIQHFETCLPFSGPCFNERCHHTQLPSQNATATLSSPLLTYSVYYQAYRLPLSHSKSVVALYSKHQCIVQIIIT